MGDNESGNETIVDGQNNSTTVDDNNDSGNSTDVSVESGVVSGNGASLDEQSNSTTTEGNDIDSIEAENATLRLVDDFDQKAEIGNKLHDFIGSLFNFNWV